MKILVLDGDGIGPEIANATVRAVDALNHRLNLGLEITRADSGLSSLEKHGVTLTDEVQAQAAEADGVILGPTHSLIYPSPEEGGINLSPWFRKTFDLYANVRPARARPARARREGPRRAQAAPALRPHSAPAARCLQPARTYVRAGCKATTSFGHN